MAAAATISGDTRCMRDARSSCALGDDERFQVLERRSQLVALNRAGWIDVFRTDLRALTDERAPPDSIVLGEHLESFRAPFVSRIEVVALRERDRGRPDEARLEAVDGT